MKLGRLKVWASRALVVFLCVLTVSCEGPEAKKLKYFTKGKELYEKNDFKTARLELKNAIQIDPKYAEAYYILGMVELKDKHINEAFGALNKAVELNPSLWDAQVELGQLMLAAKLYDKAMEKAQLILANQKDNVRGLLMKAGIYIAQNKLADAEKTLAELDGKNCTDPVYYILKASLQGGKGRLDESEALVRKGIAENPKSLVLHTVMLRILISQKRYAELVEELKTMIAIDPANDLYRFELSNAYYALGKSEEASANLAALVSEKETDEKTYIRVAQYDLGRNKLEDAISVLLKGKEKIEKSYDIHLALSEIYQRQNKKNETIEILKECLSFDKKSSEPGILKVKMRLAAIYYSTGDRNSANQYMGDVLKEDPKNADALQLQGTMYLQDGKGAEAVSSFRSVVTAKPQDETAYLLLARAHVMNNEKLLALDVLKNGTRALPDSIQLRKELIGFHVSNKDLTSAESELKVLLDKKDKNFSTLSFAGDTYMALGKKEKALEIFRQLEKENPDLPLGYIKTAQYYIDARNIDKAAASLENGRKRIPGSVDILTNLVKVYTARKEYPKAIAICNQQITAKKDEAIFRTLLGNVLEATGNLNDAKSSYESVLAMNPGLPVPAGAIARIDLAQGRPDDAERILKETLGKNPDNIALILALGDIYIKRNKYAQARSLFEDTLKRQPYNYAVTNNLAFVIGENETSPEELKKAIELEETLIKRNPGDPVVMDTLGWLYCQAGDLEKAESMLQPLITKNPESPILNYHMGVVSYKKKQAAQARALIEKALEGDKPFIGREKAKQLLEAIGKS
jgi:tetratricopeptide (TPR) repeat protein